MVARSRAVARILGLALLTAALALLGVTPAHASQTAPLNTFATATPIAVNSVGLAGAITSNGQNDYYKFSATSGTYTIDVYNAGLSLDEVCLTWFDTAQNEQSTKCGDGSGASADRVTIPVSLAGTYYFEVFTEYSSSLGTYHVRVLPDDDHGLVQNGSGEPDDLPQLAETLPVGRTAGFNRAIEPASPSYIFVNGDQDYYRFTATTAGDYTVEAYDAATSLDELCLSTYDTAGNELSTQCGNGTNNVAVRETVHVSIPGTYLAQVFGDYSNSSGTYKIRVLPPFNAGLTWDSAGEVNDTFSESDPAPLGTLLGGSIAPQPTLYLSPNPDVDYYHFSATAGTSYTVTTTNVGGSVAPDLDMTLYDSAQNSLNESYECGESTAGGGICNQLTFTPSISGTYYWELSPDYSSESGAYTVCVGRTGQVCTRPVTNGYNAVTPARLLDTRTGNGAPAGQRKAGSVTTFQVTGRDGIPSSGVAAVALNLTAVSPASAGFLTAYPSGTARPTASNVNFLTGRTTPNQALVKVGSDGKVSLYNNAATHELADVVGYYTVAGGKYVSLAPARIVDTRSGLGAPKAPVAGKATLNFQVTGRGGIPTTGVSAVALNVTTIAPAGPGFATVWPAGLSKPVVSNTNFVKNQTYASLVIVKVGAGGQVAYSPLTTANVAVDVAGYFPTGSDLTGITPARLLDTRTGSGAVGAGRTVTLKVVGLHGIPASKVKAVALNVTAVSPSASGFLTVYPAGTTRPTTSVVNYTAGDIVSNSIIAPVSSSGYVTIYTLAKTNIVADVSAYITG